MSYFEYLQKSIDYIEENIKGPITIEKCAEVAGFSKYYYYRLFTLFVGVPLMEYVRKRRLYYAMKEINEGRRIIDIALDFQYSSERAFCRAFLKEFGKAPSNFRNKRYAIPEKLILNKNKFMGGINMEYDFSDVRVGKLDTMYVASSYGISSNPEEEIKSIMRKWMEKNNIDSKARQFGFDIPVSEKQAENGLRGYEYWVQVDEATKESEGVELKKIDGCEYAILRITNPFSNPFEVIPAGWKKLMEWINSKEYCEPFKKERYCLEEEFEEDGSMYMNLYSPIN